MTRGCLPGRMQEEVETTLKAAAQLHPLALLYESKGLYTSALEVWRTLALNDFRGFSSLQTSRTGLSMKAVEPQQMVAEEAARLLEASSDSSLVLQHVGWVSFELKPVSRSCLTSCSSWIAVIC
jgi:hypothetical protein